MAINKVIAVQLLQREIVCNSKCCPLDGVADDVVIKAMQVDDVQLIDAVPEQLLQLHVQLFQLGMNGAQDHMTLPTSVPVSAVPNNPRFRYKYVKCRQ